MARKSDGIVTGTPAEWKVHTSRLLQEIGINPNMGALRIPMNLFQRILIEVAARAIEIDDDKMNRLMMRLALYEQGDPYSPDFQGDAAETKAAGRLEEVELPDELREMVVNDSPNWALLPTVGARTRSEWATMPSRIRIAVIVDHTML